MCAYVVLADDDPKQADLIRLYLEREGHSVGVVHDGRAALDEIRRRMPDLVVLDWMMPRVDGLDVCRVLRRESEVPVLMLTARAEEDDLLLALDLGADDYMTKPCSPRELVARVRTLLRRAGQATAPGAGAGAVAGSGFGARTADPVHVVGSLAVDPGRFEVRVEGRLVDCTPGEFRVIEVLASAPGRVFTRKQILEHLHGIDRYVTTRTVDGHVMNLRRKIERDPSRPERLLTVYGVGYKAAEPRPAAEPDDTAGLRAR
ncbi:response regulator transcription factor [Streptomyces sp. DSM 15324]|uniref:response regulator transcription factor n=1 Tax=Streptomyces sp. DSM 15324 TaxID=1739111 RepID=UPI00074959C3|nr:response regulator transcription factor [Streptomyces sp. DSM 15324]KUO09475.1 XRE family transcriptional regulator [Streptomyces sp. DSM 15324]